MPGSVLPLYLVTLALALAIFAIYNFPIKKESDPTLIRTMTIMTLVCMYLLWSITYLAQLNPLVAPKRSDLKPEH